MKRNARSIVPLPAPEQRSFRGMLPALLLLAPLLAQVPAPALAAPPRSLEELKSRHALEGKTPEGAARLWFEACLLYMDPATREPARSMLQALTLPFRDDPGWDSRPAARLLVERLTDPAHQHIFRSYARGARPDNGYTLDPTSWQLDVVRTERPPGETRGLKLFLRSGGADSPRPLYLKQSTATGLWYVNEFSNMYVGIRPPGPAGETFR